MIWSLSAAPDVLTQAPSSSEDATFEPICNGTLLSHSQYRKDIQENGFIDGRLLPHGNMTEEDIAAASFTPAELADAQAPVVAAADTR